MTELADSLLTDSAPILIWALDTCLSVCLRTLASLHVHLSMIHSISDSCSCSSYPYASSLSRSEARIRVHILRSSMSCFPFDIVQPKPKHIRSASRHIHDPTGGLKTKTSAYRRDPVLVGGLETLCLLARPSTGVVLVALAGGCACDSLRNSSITACAWNQR